MPASVIKGAKRDKPYNHYLEGDSSAQTPVVKLHPDDAALLGGGGGGTSTVKELQATTVSETTVAASGTIAALVTANASRRRIIATNPKASTAAIGLSTNSGATFAQCPIILNAGESWVESLAAASAWYVITETGSITVPVQTAV